MYELRILVCVLSALLFTGCVEIRNSRGSGDDDDAAGDDDDAAGDDDDATGDDDDATGDDDDATGDDDDATGDDDDATGDDDDSTEPATSASLNVGGADVLAVQSDRGDVDINGVPGTVATVWWSCWGGSATECAQTSVTADISGNAVDIRVVVPQELPDVGVDVEVDYPAYLLPELTLVDGSVTGAGVAADADVVASDGIDLSFDTIAGLTIDLQGGSGAVDVAVPSNSSAAVTAQTFSGSVVFQNLTFTGLNMGGQASGGFGSGSGASLALFTQAGDITVVGD